MMRVVSLTFIVFLIVVSIGAQTVEDEPLLTIQAHTDKVITLAVSPDGSKVASHGYTQDGTTKVWDLHTGELLYEVGEPGDYLPSCDFSPDGTQLVAVGGKKKYTTSSFALLLDAETGEVLDSLDMSFYFVATYWLGPSVFSPDGRHVLTVATEGVDEQVGSSLWEVTTGERRFKITTNAGRYACAAFSPDGKRIVVGGDKGARLYMNDSEFDVRTRELVSSRVGAIAFSPGGDEVFVWADSTVARHQVTVHDARSGEHLRSYDTPRLLRLGNPSSFSPDTTAFFNGRSLVDIASGEVIREYPYESNYRTDSVAFTRDRTRLLTGHQNGTIKIWDIGDLKTGVGSWSDHTAP